MRTITLITAIFMNFVAVIYTMIVHTTIIVPNHVPLMSKMWIWLGLPAIGLVLYSTVMVSVEIYRERTRKQDETGFSLSNLQIPSVIWLDKFSQ